LPILPARLPKNRQSVAKDKMEVVKTFSLFPKGPVDRESAIKAEVARFRQMLQEIEKQESLALISPARWAEELWKTRVEPLIEGFSTVWSRTGTSQKITKGQLAVQFFQELISPLVARSFKEQVLYYAQYEGLNHDQMAQQLSEKTTELCERSFEVLSGEPLQELEPQSDGKAAQEATTNESEEWESEKTAKTEHKDFDPRDLGKRGKLIGIALSGQRSGIGVSKIVTCMAKTKTRCPSTTYNKFRDWYLGS